MNMAGQYPKHWSPLPAHLGSSRRTNNRAAAGIIGKTDRPLSAQLKYEANRYVPPIHKNSSQETASRLSASSAAAKSRTAVPAATQTANCASATQSWLSRPMPKANGESATIANLVSV